MKITLLRHAKTEGNLQYRYVGITDDSLSQEGINHALSLGPDTSVMKVFTSELQRTQHTAQLLFPQAEIIALSGLNEMDFGSFEGRTAAEMEHESSYRDWIEGKCEGPCPDGEDRDSFTRRCVDTFLKVLANEEQEESVFVVHGGTIMAIMNTLALPVKSLYEWMPLNCGGYIVAYDRTEQGDRPLRLLESVRNKE